MHNWGSLADLVHLVAAITFCVFCGLVLGAQARPFLPPGKMAVWTGGAFLVLLGCGFLLGLVFLFAAILLLVFCIVRCCVWALTSRLAGVQARQSAAGRTQRRLKGDTQ